jgi:small-conductance mechanosensitive channel
MGFLDDVYFGNSVQRYLYAAAMVLAIFAVVRLLRMLVERRVRKLAELTQTSFDDLILELISHTRGLVVTVLGLCAGAAMLDLPERLEHFLPVLATAVLLIQVGLWGATGVAFIVDRNRRNKITAGENDTLPAFSVLALIGRGLVWAVVFLLLLDNFGVDVTALVTGLGIGGVAVALAVQKILSDLFASVSIVLDKPFQVGDFIVLDGGFMGTVKDIGLKSTRVASLSGELLVLSNSDLVNARLRNFKQMQERRIQFTFGLVYDTPIGEIEAIPGLVREIIEAQAKVRFDRAHFKEYGDSALVFEVVYIVTDPEFNVYMDIQQAINLGMMRAFQARGIEFAFPTRTVHVHGLPGTGSDDTGRAGDDEAGANGDPQAGANAGAGGRGAADEPNLSRVSPG